MCTRETSTIVFHWAFEIRPSGKAAFSVSRVQAGIAGGGWRRLRMRDGRSKTATDNKSYDDTFYRSIGERRRLRPAWKGRSWRESSSFLERDHLCCLGERLPRPREEAIYHSWNLLSTNPPIPPPDSTTRDPSTRLLAPPNTIHLPYPRPLAPLASRHADDLSLLAKLYFYVAFFLRSPPYSRFLRWFYSSSKLMIMGVTLLFNIYNRVWKFWTFNETLKSILFTFSNIVFVIMWLHNEELKNFKCV